MSATLGIHVACWATHKGGTGQDNTLDSLHTAEDEEGNRRATDVNTSGHDNMELWFTVVAFAPQLDSVDCCQLFPS